LLAPVLAAGILCVDTTLVLANATGDVDQWVLDAVREPADSALAHVAGVVTSLGDTVPLLTILIVLGALLATTLRGGWQVFALPLGAALLAWLVSLALKVTIGRQRPPVEDWAGSAHGFAFPSGHATTSTAGYLVLGFLAAAHLASRRWRVTACIVAAALPFLIGLSRVALGVHWPTDVIAGWALGVVIAYLVLHLSAAFGPEDDPARALERR
jgi:membrane-associated phospholipid phosphatase